MLGRRSYMKIQGRLRNFDDATLAISRESWSKSLPQRFAITPISVGVYPVRTPRIPLRFTRRACVSRR